MHRAGRVDVELEFSDGKLDGVWIVGQAVSIFETEMEMVPAPQRLRRRG